MKRLIWFEEIATFVGKSSFCKKLLRGFYDFFYAGRIKKSKNEIFHKNALTLLSEFDHYMSYNKIPYFFACCTLLGAVREKGFIKHDMDIDVGLWNTTDRAKVQNILERAGFRLIRRILVDEGEFACEETYEYQNVSIDLFYFYPYDGNLSSLCAFVTHPDSLSWRKEIQKYGGLVPLQLMLPVSHKIIYTDFSGLSLPIPENFAEFLECRYGHEYMIPDPTFVYPKMGSQPHKYRYDKLGVVYEC